MHAAQSRSQSIQTCSSPGWVKYCHFCSNTVRTRLPERPVRYKTSQSSGQHGVCPWLAAGRHSWPSGRARSAQTRPSPAAATRTAHRGCAPSALSAAPCHCSCANRRHSIAHDGRRLPACRQPTGLVDPCPAEHTVEHREAQGARVDESG